MLTVRAAVRSLLLFFRAWYIFFVFTAAFWRYLWWRLAGRKGGADLLRGQAIAGALERLGAALPPVVEFVQPKNPLDCDHICAYSRSFCSIFISSKAD